MKTYPVRFAHRNNLGTTPEDMEPRFVRVCPGCARPLRWRHYELLIRLDEPDDQCEEDELHFIMEPNRKAQQRGLFDALDPEDNRVPAFRWVIPRYREVAEPRCPMHGLVDWWLVFDQRQKLIVGFATPDDGGDLTSSEGGPLRTPYPIGQWRKDGNKPKGRRVVSGEQTNLLRE